MASDDSGTLAKSFSRFAMKKGVGFFLFLGLLAFAPFRAHALSGINTAYSLSITSGTALSTTAGASDVSLSVTASLGPVANTGSPNWLPLTIQLSSAGALFYDFGYSTSTPPVLSGYLPASTTATVYMVDPGLVLYIEGATATVLWKANIFGIRK